jgi:hypothetical protein
MQGLITVDSSDEGFVKHREEVTMRFGNVQVVYYNY